MRKLILFIGVALMVGCAPGKSGEIVRLDVYCDSCHIKVINRAKVGEENFIETVFDGEVNNYKSMSIDRFNSDNRCVQVAEFINYSTDTPLFIAIENNDTITGVSIEGGFCF